MRCGRNFFLKGCQRQERGGGGNVVIHTRIDWGGVNYGVNAQARERRRNPSGNKLKIKKKIDLSVMAVFLIFLLLPLCVVIYRDSYND